MSQSDIFLPDFQLIDDKEETPESTPEDKTPQEPKSNKLSCYLCGEYFRQNEMIKHVFCKDNEWAIRIHLHCADYYL
jgi:hypothetical protein